MVQFKTIIEKFGAMGEKTGWTYIIIPEEISEQLKPGYRKSFRVKGKLDSHPITHTALLPRGGGGYIMPINAEIRKAIKKGKGAELKVKMEADDSPMPLDNDFVECMEDDKRAKDFFYTLSPGHRNYFSNWISSAKTEATKAKRIAQALNAFLLKQDYGQMIRALKSNT